MTDYIRRRKVEFELCGGNLPEKYKAFVRRVLNDKNLVPAADVAEVVHCEGCKHSYTKNRPCDTALFRWCRKWDNIVRDCDFCSYGERRGDNVPD